LFFIIIILMSIKMPKSIYWQT